MKELFNISPHFTGDGFTMCLKTGVIDVPDKHGGYLVSSGQGSGKTESIKSLIRQKHDDGILYCVDTNEELGKMYDWIVCELVNSASCDLRFDDVMIVSSDSRWSHFFDIYKNNPRILLDKKVILITHVRFWTDLVNYFLVYKPKEEVRPFDGDFSSLMSRDDLRKYVVFDETPTFINPFVEFDRTLLGVFGKVDGDGKIVSKGKDELDLFYDAFIRGTGNDFFKRDCKIDRIKRDVVLNLIPKCFDTWMLSDKDAKKVGITFNPVDLCPGNVTMKNYILVFEGAADILLRGSSCFKLLDVKEKYNTVTDFARLEFGVKRKTVDNEKLSSFLDNIAKLIIKPTLVVCWKDINGEDESPGVSSYASRIRDELLRRNVNQSLFHVTYYGATDNKSTNKFRDMEQIILCGDWNLPNTEAAKIRKAYGTRTDSQAHKDWYFSQLITRIGIRKHIEGERYTVFYTDDFNQDFISRMDSYFNRNKIEERNPIKHEDWRIKLESLNIRKNVKEEIVLLAGSDDKMKEAIVQGKEYKKEVTFGFLELLGITRHDRKRQRYKPLIENLGKLGITLDIISEEKAQAA